MKDDLVGGGPCIIGPGDLGVVKYALLSGLPFGII
jgi:hypothetical protein